MRCRWHPKSRRARCKVPAAASFQLSSRVIGTSRIRRIVKSRVTVSVEKLHSETAWCQRHDRTWCHCRVRVPRAREPGEELHIRDPTRGAAFARRH